MLQFEIDLNEDELYDILDGQILQHEAPDQGVSVKQLAIDGPSENMCKFLRKNYGVEELVRQSNNFAVAPEFFQQDSDEIRYDGPSSLLFFMLCFSLIACLLYTAIDMLFFVSFEL
ncbi:hypothetical protein JYU34_022726 [Plutella xylostella]|uniref:N-acetyltransferase domain-containing protein n=1 Tax=Plutella xylostella TaxID=51655 RepID=A0ABQ7PPH3_PLUXY|nr:hypothetical protein JYU34_022726 [Plutella xylostella]